MLSLEDLEIAFQNFLLTDDPTIKNEIHTTQHFSVSDRLNIYRNAYYLRLIESLQLDYEMLHTILGDESFDELARQYIHTYPSTYRSISALGDKNMQHHYFDEIPHGRG